MIQAVIYETHSRSELENAQMVEYAVAEMNQWAADRHYEESQVKHHEGQNVETTENVETEPVCETPVIEDILVQVPLCDLYEVACLPDICPDEKECLQIEKEGVFLALLKRKEITRLDPKYMINMAESRGLFGRQGGTTNVKLSRKKAMRTRSISLKEKKLIKPKVELERLSAPTLSSRIRNIKSATEPLYCQRHLEHTSPTKLDRIPLARLWWKALLSHIKKYLHCGKKFPNIKLSRPVKVSAPTPTKMLFPTKIAKIDFSASDEENECFAINPV